MKNVVSRPPLLSCIRSSIIILLLCNIVIGCSDSTGPDDGSSEGQFTRDSIDADGGTLEVTASDGTACRLTIPEGILSETTDIKITAESSPNETMFTALANSFLLEPEGLEFDEPITIEITVPNAISSDQAPVILLTSADGSEMLLETQVDGQTLSATLEHFSRATPVAPTAAELELSWDSLVLEIDTYGLNAWRLIFLYSIYSTARFHSNDIYSSIDLDAWKEELRIQTGVLIYMGSIQCADGDHELAVRMLSVARDIAKFLELTDLEAEAQQAIDNCGTGTGTIDIDQSPDNLSGAGWSLTGPRNDNGTGDVTLLERPTGVYTMVWTDVDGYITPSSSTQTLLAYGTITFNGSYVQNSESIRIRATGVRGTAEIYLNDQAAFRFTYYGSGWDEDSKWKNITRAIAMRDGNITFRFLVKPYKYYVTIPAATFEIEVDGVVVISKRLEAADKNSSKEETIALTF